MDFICPICNQTMSYELQAIVSHSESHIIDTIKKEHPKWVQQDGICKKCYDFYRSQIPPKGKRQ